MQSHLCLRPVLLLLLLSLAIVTLHAQDWEPIDSFHLRLTEPKIDKAADAEILFWRTKIEDRVRGSDITLVRSHYARVKVYTERGRESQSTIDLLQVGKGQVSSLKARTIKPDGRIIPLEKDAVFEREVLKVSGFRVRKFSFSMPSVEVGDIIEYKWTEYLENQSANYLALEVQRDLPTWRLVLQLKPIDWGSYGVRWTMKSRSFQCDHKGWTSVGLGVYQTTFEDLPGFVEEPWGPPEDQLKSWMLVYYEEPENKDPDKFWAKFGKELYNSYKQDTKVDKKVRSLAGELTSGAANDDEKLAALVKFCKTKVKNIYHPLSGISTADLQKWKSADKPSKTIENGMGTGSEINQLFVALAAASGYDARVTRMVGRDDYVFEPEFPNAYFLRRTSVAVKVGAGWKFYDLSDPFLESGMLSWQEEGVPALISDPKAPVFEQTPVSPPGRTLTKRTANFELSEDGTLEGSVEVVMSGHTASSRKYRLTPKTEGERLEEIKEEISSRFDTAEVSDLEVEHVTDVELPLTYRYRVSIPGYAQRTGKRIFLIPSYFERNYQPRFRTSERKYPIVFRHAWEDSDEVKIRLPEGYVLDNADAPAPIKLGDVGYYESAMRVVDEDGAPTLLLKRGFSFGQKGALAFPVEAYPHIKQAFDLISNSDNHAITLKAEEGSTGGGE